jgi:hypothetical protein
MITVRCSRYIPPIQVFYIIIHTVLLIERHQPNNYRSRYQWGWLLDILGAVMADRYETADEGPYVGGSRSLRNGLDHRLHNSRHRGSGSRDRKIRG